MMKFPAQPGAVTCRDLKSLKTDLSVVNDFITSSLLIFEVDILRY